MQRGHSGKRLVAKLALVAVMASPTVLAPAYGENAKADFRWEVTKNFCALYDGSDDLKFMQAALNAYKREPNNEAAFFPAWHYYYILRDWRNAEGLARQAASRHPDWASVHFALADLAKKNLDYDGAVAEFEQAVKIKPCWPAARERLSTALSKLGRFEEAIKTADEGLKHAVGREDWIPEMQHQLLTCKAKGLLGQKNYKDAIVVLEADDKLTKYKSDLTEGDLADAYMGDRQWTQAINVLNRLQKIVPNNYFVHLSRAKAYAARGDNQLALRDADAFLSKAQNTAQGKSLGRLGERTRAHTLKSEIYEKMGKKELAAKERALIKKENEDAYDNAWFRIDEKKH